MRIQGCTAIVTGAASGLGRATAAMLGANGARVALVDRDLPRAEAAAAAIDGAEPFCLDVSDAAAAETVFAAIAEAMGAPRILVNCAGIAPSGRIVAKDGPMRLDAFAEVIRVNLIGSFNTLRLAAASMAGLEATETGERGVIVSTASVAAYEGQIGQAAYAAAKGGIASLTLPAARELARHGVRVMAVAPGLFKTPLLEAMPEAVQANLAASVPFPARLGAPEEYAALVRHIVENSMLNGEVVRLDGALRMAPR